VSSPPLPALRSKSSNRIGVASPYVLSLPVTNSSIVWLLPFNLAFKKVVAIEGLYQRVPSGAAASGLSSCTTLNPKEVDYRGSKVKLLNAENMTPQMREKLAIGFTRMSGRLMQKHFVGDSSVWMNKTLGKTLTQFRSFMLVSAEKQLVHDLRGDKTKAAQIMMWSSLLAYLSYSAQVQLAALGEEDPDEYLAQKFSDRELAFGVFNKLPQTAIISLGGDALATLGAMPEAFYAAPNRHGFRPQTTNTIAPVLGTLTDVAGAGRSVIDLISGDVEGRETAEKVRRLLPVANSVGIGQMLKAGIGEL